MKMKMRTEVVRPMGKKFVTQKSRTAARLRCLRCLEDLVEEGRIELALHVPPRRAFPEVEKGIN